MNLTFCQAGPRSLENIHHENEMFGSGISKSISNKCEVSFRSNFKKLYNFIMSRLYAEVFVVYPKGSVENYDTLSPKYYDSPLCVHSVSKIDRKFSDQNIF